MQISRSWVALVLQATRLHTAFCKIKSFIFYMKIFSAVPRRESHIFASRYDNVSLWNSNLFQFSIPRGGKNCIRSFYASNDRLQVATSISMTPLNWLKLIIQNAAFKITFNFWYLSILVKKMCTIYVSKELQYHGNDSAAVLVYNMSTVAGTPVEIQQCWLYYHQWRLKSSYLIVGFGFSTTPTAGRITVSNEAKSKYSKRLHYCNTAQNAMDYCTALKLHHCICLCILLDSNTATALHPRLCLTTPLCSFTGGWACCTAVHLYRSPNSFSNCTAASKTFFCTCR